MQVVIAQGRVQQHRVAVQGPDGEAEVGAELTADPHEGTLEPARRDGFRIAEDQSDIGFVDRNASRVDRGLGRRWRIVLTPSAVVFAQGDALTVVPWEAVDEVKALES